MKQDMGYLCWTLDASERDALLAAIPPLYCDVVAHHVTYRHGVLQPDVLEIEPIEGLIVGEIADKGVQALVVEINHNTIRADGHRYHITWSLDSGRFPQESIRLTDRGWFPFEKPFPVHLTPGWFKSTER